jgi:hypothetical protein
MSATAASRRSEADTASPARAAAPRREVLAFRAALAAILLAVADDAFVHPEPGTGAPDHLASGLLPLAIGLGLMLAYPRLRAGVRAVAGLVCARSPLSPLPWTATGTSPSIASPVTT